MTALQTDQATTAVEKMEEAQELLSDALALLRDASRELRTAGFPACTWGQLDGYTIPSIERFISPECRDSQSGNLNGIADSIEDHEDSE